MSLSSSEWEGDQWQWMQLQTGSTMRQQSPASAKKQKLHDRFIPARCGIDFDVSHLNLTKENKPPEGADERERKEYEELLAQGLFDGQEHKKVLNFTPRKIPNVGGFQKGLREVYTVNRTASAPTRRANRRYISQNPERILDAPELMDDFYLNLLDWNQDNILAVALGQTVYLWNATNGNIQELMQASGTDNYITSISWIQRGKFIAVGTNAAEVQLWDTERLKQVRNMKGHLARVGALAWNDYLVSSGSRDSLIFNHDVRIANHHISTLEGHRQEVCGLKWCADGRQLASGGNDNLLNIWDVARSTPRYTLDNHQAAVKALAWCPFQRNLLASGGGTADRNICYWNTSTGTLLNSVDTKSQVCSLLWSKRDKELLSSHGFSHNQLILWKYPSMVKLAELEGHSSRVLHLAQSPDGTTIVSAAADETLRFWRVFGPCEKKKDKEDQPNKLYNSLRLR